MHFKVREDGLLELDLEPFQRAAEVRAVAAMWSQQLTPPPGGASLLDTCNALLARQGLTYRIDPSKRQLDTALELERVAKTLEGAFS